MHGHSRCDAAHETGLTKKCRRAVLRSRFSGECSVKPFASNRVYWQVNCDYW